jgi:hypothetical protein
MMLRARRSEELGALASYRYPAIRARSRSRRRIELGCGCSSRAGVNRRGLRRWRRRRYGAPTPRRPWLPPWTRTPRRWRRSRRSRSSTATGTARPTCTPRRFKLTHRACKRRQPDRGQAVFTLGVSALGATGQGNLSNIGTLFLARAAVTLAADSVGCRSTSRYRHPSRDDLDRPRSPGTGRGCCTARCCGDPRHDHLDRGVAVQPALGRGPRPARRDAEPQGHHHLSDGNWIGRVIGLHAPRC